MIKYNCIICRIETNPRLGIAICNDNPQQLQNIKAATNAYFKAHNSIRNSRKLPDVFRTAGKKLWHGIALLDICMPGILDAQVARDIRRRHDKTEIIRLFENNRIGGGFKK